RGGARLVRVGHVRGGPLGAGGRGERDGGEESDEGLVHGPQTGRAPSGHRYGIVRARCAAEITERSLTSDAPKTTKPIAYSATPTTVRSVACTGSCGPAPARMSWPARLRICAA